MWTKFHKINRLSDIFMTAAIVLQTSTALLDGNIRMLTIQACFAIVWIGLMLVTSYLERQMAREKKHDSNMDAIDTSRLARLSLPEVYEDYLRRKSQAQALYEAEIDLLDKDYAQYLNALEEEALNADAR